MTLEEYIKNKGLTSKIVYQQMGVSRQAFERYNKGHAPTARTQARIAKAMTELGVPTTVVDIMPCFSQYYQ